MGETTFRFCPLFSLNDRMIDARSVDAAATARDSEAGLACIRHQELHLQLTTSLLAIPLTVCGEVYLLSMQEVHIYAVTRSRLWLLHRLHADVPCHWECRPRAALQSSYRRLCLGHIAPQGHKLTVHTRETVNTRIRNPAGAKWENPGKTGSDTTWVEKGVTHSCMSLSFVASCCERAGTGPATRAGRT